MKKLVSAPFVETCLRKYPALIHDLKLRGLFRWWRFSTFHDDETGLLVIPRSKLWAELAPEIEERAFNVTALLREMQQKVLPDLRWSSWSRDQRRARQILNNGFDAEMVAHLDAELRLPFDKAFTGMVNFVTGRGYDKSRLYPAMEEHRKLVQEAKLNPTQSKILDYLDALDGGRLLLPKLSKNKEAIELEIAKLPDRVANIQRRIINSMIEQPHVFYRPGDRTCRLNACGDSVLGLKREVRKALCAGWTESDLRSSQFAILASVLDAPISKALIDSGVSLWRSLYLHTHEVDEDPTKAIKAIFKEVVYSVAFGKSAANLARLLRPHGLEPLLEHPVLRELLELRGRWFERIDAAGGATDVWGTWHAIRAQKDCAQGERSRLARHIAATVIQSWEMEIILAPIFTVAAQHGDTYQFRIVLFQHDGATISFRAHDVRKDRAKKLLRDAVETRAKELGVHTTLEFVDLELEPVITLIAIAPSGGDDGDEDEWGSDPEVDRWVAQLERDPRVGGHIADFVRKPQTPCHVCGMASTQFYDGKVIQEWSCPSCWHRIDEADESMVLHLGPDWVEMANAWRARYVADVAEQHGVAR